MCPAYSVPATIEGQCYVNLTFTERALGKGLPRSGRGLTGQWGGLPIALGLGNPFPQEIPGGRGQAPHWDIQIPQGAGANEKLRTETGFGPGRIAKA